MLGFFSCLRILYKIRHFDMTSFLKFHAILNSIKSQKKTAIASCVNYYHIGANPNFSSSDSSSTSASQIQNPQNKVAIFWDLDNKPPKSTSPYDAAILLKKAAHSFGYVHNMTAYANRHAFIHVPQEVREQRKDRKKQSQLENLGVLKPDKPYICRVCGRRFHHHDKFINHFKQIHEREYEKRLNQIESARGSRRVKLVGKYSIKMDKFKYAAKDVLTPKVGYGLADEIKRAGFRVNLVPDKPQAADSALINHAVDLMDKRRVECLILVSDDKDFVEVLKEAKLRCVRTVVVGDVSDDGALKRVADMAFSWQEILMGKAKKQAPSVVGRWKDRDVLKRLEWSYDHATDKKHYDDDVKNRDGESSDLDGFFTDYSGDSDDHDDDVEKNDRVWWKLEPDSVVESR